MIAPTYLHVLDDRLRVRLPELKVSPQRATRIEATLHGHAGVTRTEVNPLTGSILVHFEPGRTSAAEILALLNVSSRPAPRVGAGVPISSSSGLLRLPISGEEVAGILMRKGLEVAAQRLLLALL